MTGMLAAFMTEYGRPLVVDELPRPVPRDPLDVIVRVAGAGVCGSDVHLREGMFVDNLGRASFPYILGHENVGTVEDIGSAVSTLQPGDVVALHPLITCGVCRGCRSGRDMYCTSSQFPGVDGRTSGGYAEYLRTSARSCVPLGDGVDPVHIVAATDAGLTAYHAVKRLLPWVRPGQVAVVLGAGGVGQFVVQCLRALTGVTVIASDVRPERLIDATRLGAHGTVLSAAGGSVTDGWNDYVGAADIVVDCVGAASTHELALELLSRGGVLSIVGATGDEFRLTSAVATVRELTVLGNYVGSYDDLLELVALVRTGDVVSQHVSYPLAAAEDALHDLASGRLSGRAVLVP